MFLRMLYVRRVGPSGAGEPVPLARLDSFAMRSFTNDAEFDDTLPVSDGVLEAGFRVSPAALARAMEAWFRRKGWLGAAERLEVREQERAPAHPNQRQPGEEAGC